MMGQDGDVSFRFRCSPVFSFLPGSQHYGNRFLQQHAHTRRPHGLIRRPYVGCAAPALTLEIKSKAQHLAFVSGRKLFKGLPMLSHEPINTSLKTYQSTSERPSFTRTQNSKAAVRHTSSESSHNLKSPAASYPGPSTTIVVSVHYYHSSMPSGSSYFIPFHPSTIVIAFTTAGPLLPSFTLDHPRLLPALRHLPQPRVRYLGSHINLKTRL